METLSQLAYGFTSIMQPGPLLAAVMGVIIGTLTGVLPGLGVTGAMALLLPVSFGMDPTSAIIMFAGIYYGAMYGGSTTAILVNVPGEAASVITCLDGNQMAKKGRAGVALSIAAIGSFVAGTLGVVGLSFFAPVLADVALTFGPPEYFAIALLGLVILTNLTGDSPLKSLLMVLFGLMISTVGLDTIAGIERFTVGLDPLLRGIDFGIIAMAVFGISEIIHTLTHRSDDFLVKKVKLREMYPSKADIKRSAGPIFRGGVMGFLIGLLPGPAGTLASFSSYAAEKKISKRPEEFGHGAIEGVAGPESANNAASSASMIPLLSLGLPFSPPAALLLSGFIIHGITPGPSLISQHADLFWGLIASMYIGNVLLLIINLPLVGIFASMLKTPVGILMPVVAIITFTGGYASNSSYFDLLLLVLFGVFAYFIRNYGYSMAPLAVGIVLGPTIESGLSQGLIISNGSVMELMSRPIAGTMIGIAILFVILTVLKPIRRLLSHSKES